MTTKHKRAMARRRHEWLLTFRVRQFWVAFGGYIVGGLFAIVIVAMIGASL